MRIPLSRPIIGEEEKKAVLEVLESGQLAQGEQVASFEREFAEYIGTKEAVATSSGTAALFVALKALGVQPGDKVVTTPFTFVATASAILHCGGIPVFCDVDRKTCNLDPERLKATLEREPGVKGVVVVHLYGIPCALEEILDITRSRGLFLLEDCAQAHGAMYRGRKVGSFGDAGVFSFYPTKNMTTGEGKGSATTVVPDFIVEAAPRKRRPQKPCADLHALDSGDPHEVEGQTAIKTSLEFDVASKTRNHVEGYNDEGPSQGIATVHGLGDTPFHFLFFPRCRKRGKEGSLQHLFKGVTLHLHPDTPNALHESSHTNAKVPEEELGHRPGNASTNRFSRACPLDDVANIIKTVLHHPSKVGMPRPWNGNRFIPFRLFPHRVHQRSPLLVLTVLNPKNQRAPQGLAEAETREHFHPVLLKVHPGTHTEPLSPSGKFALNEGHVNVHSCGESAQIHEDALPMRFSCSTKLKTHILFAP